MTPPVIVNARGELLFFSSPESAEAYIEEIDVRNGEYGPCWDSLGRPLALRVGSNPRSAFRLLPGSVEQVALHQLDELPSQSEQLRQALVTFLAETGAAGEDPGTRASRPRRAGGARGGEVAS